MQMHKMQNVLVSSVSQMIFSVKHRAMTTICQQTEKKIIKLDLLMGSFCIYDMYDDLVPDAIFCDIKIISDIILNGQFYFHIFAFILILFRLFTKCAPIFHLKREKDGFLSLLLLLLPWASQVCVIIVVCVLFNWKLNK